VKVEKLVDALELFLGGIAFGLGFGIALAILHLVHV
jgi:hypothetical protein